jgi:hypothetical protein
MSLNFCNFMNTRRQFIMKVAYGALGVSVLPDFAQGNITDKTGKKTAKHVIYIYNNGGMSHLDTFDPKTHADVKGDFNPIGTKVAGIQLSDQFEKLALHADKMAIVRGMSVTTGDHAGGQYLAHTSYKKIGTTIHPAMGAWMCNFQDDHQVRPFPLNYVINGGNDHPGAGWMEKKYSPVPIHDPLRGVENTNIKDKEDFNKRVSILKELNRQSDKLPNPYVKGYVEFYDQTVRLLNSKDLEVFDLTKEPQATRDKYGNNKTGQGLCLARRLIEKAGAKFVEVSIGGWDNHVDITNAIKPNITSLDQGLSALLDDLQSSGLLSETLIVIATEFGRTPTININKGRDHYPKAYSQVLIGAGVKNGIVYGSTDERGMEVTDGQVTVQDFNATIAAAIGLPVEEKKISPEGRPFTVADKGRPIAALLA